MVISLDTLLLIALCVLVAYLLWCQRASASPDGAKALEGAVRSEFSQSRNETAVAHRDLRAEVSALVRDFREEVAARASQSNTQSDQAARALREETMLALNKMSELQTQSFDALAQRMLERLDAFSRSLSEVAQKTETSAGDLRKEVGEQLEKMRVTNEERLEKMRATVEEKLQGTLEQRLGESFKLVSERLEQVHAGLGEMRSLATGVGDLKRVLTNVKSRGGWGETQLSQLLEDMLTKDQFARQVRIRPASSELVDFAVRLPGKDDGAPVFLPIDAKFPQEDYERLLAAQESAGPDDVEKAAAALEKAVRTQAKSISEKYIHPPHSTEFAILYLPTEGLFAEVIRRPGLVSDLQTKHRVMVTGPTTLCAILNSLQMGFRTMAIEKRSSEVWQVLASAKTEFGKYAKVWDLLGKQLDTARRTVEEGGKRTRMLERSLKGVETLDQSVEPTLLEFIAPNEDDDRLEESDAA